MSRRTMQMTLPAYERDHSRWRERILTRALEVATDTAVSYTAGDKLEVVLLLYLREGKRLTIHDAAPESDAAALQRACPADLRR